MLANTNNDSINSNSDATKILGPDGEFNSSDANSPNITDKVAPIAENIIICFGFLDKFRAIAAGINKSPVISSIST